MNFISKRKCISKCEIGVKFKYKIEVRAEVGVRNFRNTYNTIGTDSTGKIAPHLIFAIG